MHGFLVGVVLGFSIGAAVTASAATLVGGDGYLLGWDVEVKGNTVCSDPFIWSSTKEIECD